MTRGRSLIVALAIVVGGSACSTSAELDVGATTDASTQSDQVAGQSAIPAIEPTSVPVEEPSPVPTEVPTPEPTATEVPTVEPVLREMTGFCADAPLEAITAVFPDAAIDRTFGLAVRDEDCEVEIKASNGTLLASFTIGFIPDVAPGGFERANDVLFENNIMIAETLDLPPPERQLVDIGDQAEYMTGFRTQVAMLDGDTLWIVWQASSNRASPMDELVAIARAYFDNRPPVK